MSDPEPNPFPLLRYFFHALQLVRMTPLVLWSLAAIGGCGVAATVFRDTAASIPLSIGSVVLSTAASPVFYGIYYRMIDDSYTTVADIAKTYLLPYFWLLLRMYLPPIILAGIPAGLTGEHSVGGYLEVTLVVFSMLYIYVIPWYYCSGQQRGAIIHGVSFLFQHLAATTPLLMIVLLLEAAVLIFQRVKTVVFPSHPIIMAGLDFSVFFIASVIDLMIFIMLIFVVYDTKQKT